MPQVKCCVLGTVVDLVTNYPTDTSPEMVAEIDVAAAAWLRDYHAGEVFFLSPEALDKGFAFWNHLELEERPSYRFVKELGTDILCRHSKYFVNPADQNDFRMVDDVAKVVMPVNRAKILLSKDSTERIVLPTRIFAEGAAPAKRAT